MATSTKTQAKAEAWQIACADIGVDCAFLIRNHDKKELAQFAISHAKNTHGIPGMSEKDAMGMAKPAKW